MDAGAGGIDVEKWLKNAERDLLSSTTNYYTPIAALITVIRRQQAQIAALERLHPAMHLEGTGPLPLERKEAP